MKTILFSQGLKDQLTTAVENEKRAQDELEVLKEEISAERASVQASRIIEMQKRELAVNKQIETFNKSQEALNKRIDSLAVAMGQLSKVQVEIAGRKLGEDKNRIINFLCQNPESHIETDHKFLFFFIFHFFRSGRK